MDDGRLQVDGRNGDLPGFGPLDNRLALGVNAELIVMHEVGVCLLRGISVSDASAYAFPRPFKFPTSGLYWLLCSRGLFSFLEC